MCGYGTAGRSALRLCRYRLKTPCDPSGLLQQACCLARAHSRREEPRSKRRINIRIRQPISWVSGILADGRQPPDGLFSLFGSPIKHNVGPQAGRPIPAPVGTFQDIRNTAHNLGLTGCQAPGSTFPIARDTFWRPCVSS